ncbi:hypothetical protein MRX96_009990 [Rhipicephalus microplus]
MVFSSSTMKKMILDGECRSSNTPNVTSLPVVRACNCYDFHLIYDCTAKNLDYKDLMQLYDQIFDSLVIMQQACESIQIRTRSQALSVNWVQPLSGAINLLAFGDCDLEELLEAIPAWKRLNYSAELLLQCWHVVVPNNHQVTDVQLGRRRRLAVIGGEQEK